MPDGHADDGLIQEVVEQDGPSLCRRGRPDELIVPRRDSLAHVDPALHREMARHILGILVGSTGIAMMVLALMPQKAEFRCLHGWSCDGLTSCEILPWTSIPLAKMKRARRFSHDDSAMLGFGPFSPDL